MSEPPGALPDTSPGDVARPVNLASTFIRGTAAFGIAAAAQRIPGYLGALIAARVAGPETMGVYATSIATASLVASYAGLSLGSVATTFGADSQRSGGYPRFIRLFTGYCLGIAAIAGLLGALLAGIISNYVFDEASFQDVLLLGGATAAGFVLLDGVTGLLTGTLRFKAIIVLSVLTGMLTLGALVYGAQHGAQAMVLGQAIAILGPSLACLAFLFLAAPKGGRTDSSLSIADFLRWGALQLGGSAALGLASWYVVAALVQHDETGRSVGLYSIGQQLNSLALLIPGLAVQLVLPLVMRLKGHSGEQVRAVAVASYSSMSLALPIGGILLIAAPTFVDAYGEAFGAGSKAAGLLVAAAIISVSTASLGNAVLGHSARLAMLTNLGGALTLGSLSYLLVPRSGPTGAAIAWLISYLASGVVWQSLAKRLGLLPSGFAQTWAIICGTTLLTGALSFARSEGFEPTIALVQLAVVTVGTWAIVQRSVSGGHLPSLTAIGRIASDAFRRAPD